MVLVSIQTVERSIQIKIHLLGFKFVSESLQTEGSELKYLEKARVHLQSPW